MSRLKQLVSGDLQIMMVSNGFESAMRFAALIIYSKILSPVGLGIVALVTALVQLSIQTTQLGIDTSVISLGSKEYGRSDFPALARICQGGLWLHLALGVSLAAVGIALAPMVAERYVEDPALSGALIFAFAGILVTRLADYVLSVLRTYQRFTAYALAGLASALVLLTSVVVLALREQLSVSNVIALTLFWTPLVQLAAGLAGSPRGLLLPRLPDRGVCRQILGFGKWVWGTAVLESGVRRFNVVLLQAFAGNEATGYFHMASRLAEFLSLIFEPVRKYLLPKFTALTRTEEMRSALRRTYAKLLWTLAIVPVAWLLARPAIALYPGPEWSPTVLLFQILLLGRLFFLLSKPLVFVLFALKRPQVQTLLHLVGLVLYLPAAVAFIPPFGALGSACCILFFSLTILLSFTWYVLRTLRTGPEEIGG